MLRPSTCTNNLLDKRSLKPRELTAQRSPEICATLRPGTKRKASGIDCAPERRISSAEITYAAAAMSATRCSLRDMDIRR